MHVRGECPLAFAFVSATDGVLDAEIKHQTDVAISLWESALVACGLA